MLNVEEILGRRRRSPRLSEEPGITEGPALQDVRLAELYLSCPHCRALGTDEAVECRACGLIFAKWRRRRHSEPAVRSSFGRIRLAAAALGLLLALGYGLTPPDNEVVASSAWRPSMEISQVSFDGTVLRGDVPTLVMFNVRPKCGCAEEELYQLREQWRGRILVVTLNAVDSPALAAQYGVEEHPIVMLFDKGSLVKRADASEMEDRVEARHGGSYDGADMKAELEGFARNA